jgi:uncharacterized damage-inducible protein DinB
VTDDIEPRTDSHRDPGGFREVGPDYGPERTLVETLLDFHRGTLLWKVAGLTPDQLTTRAGGSSELTLLGIVRHLAEVERFWWRRVATQTAAGPLYEVADDPDADFHGGDASTAEADIAALRAEIEAAKAAVADIPLDREFESNDGGPMSLRWVYLHMIQEYARHNGHADILRENLDGLTGE